MSVAASGLGVLKSNVREARRKFLMPRPLGVSHAPVGEFISKLTLKMKNCNAHTTQYSIATDKSTETS